MIDNFKFYLGRTKKIFFWWIELYIWMMYDCMIYDLLIYDMYVAPHFEIEMKINVKFNQTGE